MNDAVLALDKSALEWYNTAAYFKERLVTYMPYIDTVTTVNITPEQEAHLTREFGKAIELISGKSEEWLMLNFNGASRMAFRGVSTSDIAMIDVYLFGKAKDYEYDKLTEKLCETVSSILNVPRNRIYVKYTEQERWGYNGINF